MVTYEAKLVMLRVETTVGRPLTQGACVDGEFLQPETECESVDCEYRGEDNGRDEMPREIARGG